MKVLFPNGKPQVVLFKKDRKTLQTAKELLTNLGRVVGGQELLDAATTIDMVLATSVEEKQRELPLEHSSQKNAPW